MARRSAVLALTLTIALLAASKPSPTPTAKVSNMMVELTATLYVDKASIQQLIGSDLGGYYVAMDVRVVPRTGEKFKLSREDFQLRTDRDGERSRPFSPSQVAGRGALVVTRTYDGTTVAGGNSRPTIGGTLGGMAGGTGSTPASITNTAKMDSNAKNDENALLGLLTEKILHEGDIDQPASGWLLFPMDPKQKIKDLELTYAGPGSRLTLRFR